MATISVGNDAVSEQLAKDESFTVPDGEKWVVFPSATGSPKISINGTEAMAPEDGGSSKLPDRLVLTGGDTLNETASGFFSITGWKL
jgi:hypothetical protein